MRILASMCVLSLRWRPPTLSSNEYEELTALAELFERTLKQTLEEFTKTDATHHIRWTFRRPTQDDPLPPSFKSARLCLVVEIVELDPEMALLDELPSYQVAISSTPNVATLPPSYSEVTMRQHLPSFQCPMRPEPVMVRATSPPCNTALS
ncbi:hypothetical protein DFQ28_007244 [Apophysomyces sp. BC1034]|nr:hypothetical protein DFQ30_006340 [Apophysomyces sp. BC1015]KAG0182282.1 hypothetical protein DFQ29_005013 [Apophysomyces sp. BC1021]KAG0192901.1 hypothetical protein DFQ28_007244 [Apophysomyces sp. BC1034]